MKPERIVGRTITAVDMGEEIVGQDVMHSPIVYLDDGTTLTFLAEEPPGEDGEYGVNIIAARVKSSSTPTKRLVFTKIEIKALAIALDMLTGDLAPLISGSVMTAKTRKAFKTAHAKIECAR